MSGRGVFGIHQLSHQQGRRLIGPGRTGEGLFSVHTPPLRQTVPAVRVNNSVLRQMPQPEVERHVRLLKVLGQPLIRLDEHILDDIRRVHPTSQDRVQSQSNHLPQWIAELAKEIVNRPRLAVACGSQKIVGLFTGWPHGISVAAVRDTKSAVRVEMSDHSWAEVVSRDERP